MTEEEKSHLTFFGPSEDYTMFRLVLEPFARVGYLVFVKLTASGWFGELRMPVLPEKEVGEEKF